jgi:hypothetical protein
MKAFLQLIMVSAIGVFLSNCSDDKNANGAINVIYDDELVGLDEFEAFSLAAFGINALIYLPDETSDIGAAAAPRVEHEPDGFKWDLFVGQNFHMRIDDWGDDEMIGFHKEELADYSKMYDIEFLEETENFLYYKRTLKVEGKKEADKNVGIEHVSFYCYGQHTIEGINYVFRINDAGHPKPITTYMAKSIKSVKEIVK